MGKNPNRIKSSYKPAREKLLIPNRNMGRRNNRNEQIIHRRYETPIKYKTFNSRSNSN